MLAVPVTQPTGATLAATVGSEMEKMLGDCRYLNQEIPSSKPYRNVTPTAVLNQPAVETSGRLIEKLQNQSFWKQSPRIRILSKQPE